MNYNVAWIFLLVIVWLAVLTNEKTNFKPLTGSWDPQFTAAGNSLSATSTGNYNQIGNMMFFCVNVQFTDSSSLGGVNDVYQFILPTPARQTFTSRGGSLHNPIAAVAPQAPANLQIHIAGIVDTAVSNSIMKLYYTGSTTDLGLRNNVPNQWATPSSSVPSVHLDISGFYEIE